MSDVSGAMLQNKIDHIEQCDAEMILSGDVSCMTHMNGGLEKHSGTKRVKHIADILAEAIR